MSPSTVYLIALCAVGAALIAAALDAILSVSRRPQWDLASRSLLVRVETEDRRGHDLPFVGQERRERAAAADLVADTRIREAA